jgi:signal transduction histidine kinase/CHASE3 domain sensor protein
MKLTLFRKGLILVGIPFLFQLLLIFLFLEMHDRNAKNQAWFLRSKDISGQAQNVLRLMVDAETGIRGYIATGDASFTEPYDQAVEQLPGALEKLRNLTRLIPDVSDRVSRIEAQSGDILHAHDEKMDLMRADKKEIAIEKIVAGKPRMDAFRAEVDALLDAEQELEIQRQKAVRVARSDSYALAVLGAMMTLVSALVLGRVFSRGISGRLKVLTENAQRCAEGKELLPAGPGNDEITQVDRAFRDMEQRVVNSQAALNEQRRLLQSILEGMGDGVVACDENGQFLVWNPAAERTLGVRAIAAPPAEWSKTFGFFLADQVTPLATEEHPLMRAVRGEAPNQVELFIRNANLREGIFIAVTARPLQNDQGSCRGGVAVFHDITEKRHAAERVRKMNEELERRVQERTMELVEVNRDLAQKNQENEMFVYSVSHDLRSPLVNLQGFSKELEKGCQALAALLADEAVPSQVKTQTMALLDGKMGKSLGFIKTAVLRLASIIDALLRLSRAGRIEYRLEKVDMDKLVARVLGSVAGTIQERGVTVTTTTLPPARGDQAAVEQVVANLIGNALTYLDPSRPGAIQIGCLDPTPPNTPDGFRVYYVKDNGLGIAESHRQKVFQIFQRLHPGVGKGEGMGLAIVMRVVERHGGKAWVESTVNQGSTFFFSLPASTGDSRW